MRVDPAEKTGTSRALFISDLHLAASAPKTTAAFLDFLACHARKSERLYILGDLFEYWVGDDDIKNPYNQRIIKAIRQLVMAHVPVYWIPGNRDFLAGKQFAVESGVIFLPDLYTAKIDGMCVAMSHGDAECLEDPGYTRYRNATRNPLLQWLFLFLPLKTRKNIAERLRLARYGKKATMPDPSWDLSASAIDAILKPPVTAFVHGHTHQPAIHTHGEKQRYVLPDWDLDGPEKRGGWLELTASGKFVPHVVWHEVPHPDSSNTSS